MLNGTDAQPSVSESSDLAFAFFLTAAAGLSTTIGSIIALFVSVNNKRALAYGLYFSAGVMIFVSFVEILAKSISAFEESSAPGAAQFLAYGFFFLGCLFTLLLDKLVHRVSGHGTHDEKENALNDLFNRGGAGARVEHAHQKAALKSPHGGASSTQQTPSTHAGAQQQQGATLLDRVEAMEAMDGGGAKRVDCKRLLAVLGHPLLEPDFYKFLCGQHQEESLQFYRDAIRFNALVESPSQQGWCREEGQQEQGEGVGGAAGTASSTDPALMSALGRLVALYICREAGRQINLPHAMREDVLSQFRELSERYRWAPNGTDAVAYALRTCTPAAAATDVALTINSPPQKHVAGNTVSPVPLVPLAESKSGGVGTASLLPGTPGRSLFPLTLTQTSTAAKFGTVLRAPMAAVVELMASNSLHPFCALQREAFAAATLHSTGVFTALAIALHNFPEGLATFVAALDDPAVGVGVAFAIAVHNIPEGLCVSMPLYYSSKSRCKALLWSTLSGVTETLGAALGYFILSAAFTPFTFGAVFGAVAGIMVYLSFVELIPAARGHDPEGAYAGPGLFAGMAVMALSLALFTL